MQMGQRGRNEEDDMIPDRRHLDDSTTFFQPIWRGKTESGENKVRKKKINQNFSKGVILIYTRREHNGLW